MVRKFPMLLLACAGLSGCEYFERGVTCLDQDGQEVTISIMKDRIIKDVTDINRNGTAMPKSKIRALLDQVKFSIEDVRTTKEDPQSTKKFCTGTLKATFPQNVLTEANNALVAMDVNNITKQAEEKGFERNANTFSIEIDYNVQPTDDGKSVYSEFEDVVTPADFYSGIVASALFSKQINREIADQKASEEAEQAAQAAIEKEVKDANYASAKAQSDLAVQTINMAWKNLPEDFRSQILPVQRAWIKQKEADCRMEAAQASTDPTERETARLHCTANRDMQRAQELQRAGNNFTNTYANTY